MKFENNTVLTSRDLSTRTMNLEDRYHDTWVNSIFKDNILLSMAYLRGAKALSGPLDWSAIRKPFTYSFTLQPNQAFAFHDDVLSQYHGKVVKTTSAHFNISEGFKSDGYLVGDGVCHLASIIYWAAKDANLAALAPTNHNFALIPDIPAQYGVAIYNDPMNKGANEQQNLYITNNKSHPVTFTFTYNGKNLTVAVTEANDSSLARK